MNSLFDQLGLLFSNYNIPAAFWVNIQLTFWAAIGATVLGTVLALMRVSPAPSLQLAGAFYVNVVRNTPLTIIIMLGFAGVLGALQIRLVSNPLQNVFIVAVLGLAAYHAAFVCEAIRSGVNTVPLGQAEAARAIGLPFLPAARLILFPQAIRGAIAPLGNVLIALIKNTTVAAVGSVATETSSVMKTMIEFNGNLAFLIFMIFAVGYVILVVPVGIITTSLSKKLAVAR